MNKYIKLLSLLAAVVILLGGCTTMVGSTGNSDDTVKKGNEAGNDDMQGGNDTNTSVFKAEVIEAGNSLFIAPDPESNEYKSSDKMSVNITKCTFKDIDGNEISNNELKAGDIISISYDGTIMESYPAQIIASVVKITDHDILIDGYLKVIDDIWQQDTGLNSDIDMIGVDTTDWVELTDIQKEIILTKMKADYGLEIVEGSSDELAKQGLIDKDNLYFSKGVLITINNMTYDKENKEMTYSIKKWRSGDGAIGANNNKASYNGSDWEIQGGESWIS